MWNYCWFKLTGVRKILLFGLLLKIYSSNGESCNHRPLPLSTDALAPDSQFLIEIEDLQGDQYIPKENYTVHLHSRDYTSTFIAFSISLQPDTMENIANPRKRLALNPGRLEPLPEFPNTRYKYDCENTIIQSDITAKTSVKALWTAPDKDNKCVTIFAIVVVEAEVWYNFAGPLSKRVCEDRRKADDMPPMENNNCQVCEDARYQLTIQGMWSYNTHPYMYPETQHLARFSDVVGASHSKDFIMYKYNMEASKGLKMLAEQGNTTELELEIQKYINSSVRTVIKATAPRLPNQATITSFRVTRTHHLVSLATALMPSPDWFLGVANLELCHVKTNSWAENVVLNLYPADAGTDKGLTFESANDETSPPQPISSALPKDMNKEEIKPFARLLFTLVRTYPNPECIEKTTTATTEEGDANDNESGGDGEEGADDSDNNQDGDKPDTEETDVSETTSGLPTTVDPTATPDCPLAEWGAWLPCAGDCYENQITGYQLRMRKFISSSTSEYGVDVPWSYYKYIYSWKASTAEHRPAPSNATMNDNKTII